MEREALADVLIHYKILSHFESARVSCSDVNRGQTKNYALFFLTCICKKMFASLTSKFTGQIDGIF